MEVLSPLVATREFCELRYCQQTEQGSWIVVNVSYDLPQFVSHSQSYRFPSGCLIQDMPNGYSKVKLLFPLSTKSCFHVRISLNWWIETGYLGWTYWNWRKRTGSWAIQRDYSQRDCFWGWSLGYHSPENVWKICFSIGTSVFISWSRWR